MQRTRNGWRHVVFGMLAVGLLPLLISVALNGGGSAEAGVHLADADARSGSPALARA